MTTIYFHGEAAADDALLAALASSDAAIFGDLTGLCVLAPEIARDAAIGATHILAPYSPRAIRWLLAYADAELAPDASLIDSRRDDDLPNGAGAAASDLHSVREAIASLVPAGDWRPWYPVVDREQCTACGQCVSFCLFGVYRQDGETVRVVEPTKCKNNCPACARACPQNAIVFPKCTEPGIDGYASNGDSDNGKKLAGNILDQLRARTGGSPIPREITERLKHIDPDNESGLQPDQKDSL